MTKINQLHEKARPLVRTDTDKVKQIENGIQAAMALDGNAACTALDNLF